MAAGQWGALDSLAAGVGNTDARERFVAEQATRRRPARDTIAELASTELPPSDTPSTLQWEPPAEGPTADFGVESAGVPLRELAERDLAAEQAPPDGVGMQVGGQAVDLGSLANANAYGIASQLLAQQTRVRANPDYKATRTYIGETADASGRERQAARQILDAEAST